MSKMSSKWAHWTQSKLCLVTQLFPFPEEKEQRPAVEKKKNGTYFPPCGQWLNFKKLEKPTLGAVHLTFEGGCGGGGVWVISVKNILQTNFKGKISFEEIPEEKKISCTEKNYLSWHINYAGKKSSTIICQGKKFQRPGRKISYPNHITYTPPPRSQIVNPWVRFVSLTFFQQFLELVGPNNSI